MEDEDDIGGKPDPKTLELELDPDGKPIEDGDDGGPLTVGDFHTIAQKQILNAVYSLLSDTKMDWALIAPFLETAREICLGDFEETGRVRLHVLRAEGDDWIEAEEAFIGISVSDREDGQEWLSETYWLSDVAIADPDPEQVRAIARGLERSLAKINAWLADKPAADPGEATPAESPEA
jgi:hypothetical protein